MGEKTGILFSVKNRIMFLVLLIMIPNSVFLLFFLFGFYSYAFHNIINGKELLAEEMTRGMDYQLRFYKNMTMAVYYNPLTRSYINEGDYEVENEYVMAYLSGIVNSERSIVAAVMEIDGNVYSSGYNYYNIDSYMERHREKVLLRAGKVVWIPTEIMEARNHSNLKNFALARAVNSKEGAVGTLWIFFDVDFISDILGYENYNQGDSSYYLMAEDNLIVCSTDSALIGKYLDYQEIGEAITHAEHSSKGYYVDRNHIVICRKSNITGWNNTIVIRKGAAFAQADSIRKTMLFLLGFELLLIAGVYRLLTKLIFEPLNYLSGGLQNVSKKEFIKIPEGRKRDEVNLLLTHYNSMVDEIQHLMKEIREEEKQKNEEKLKVLSLQINPHFTFNTLNTIRWMAIANKQTNIMKMVECLTALMRNVTYAQNDEVEIEKEIELIESYVYIQKMRFLNFNIEYRLGEDVKRLKILKLLLQPLIENCIVHGFQGLSRQGIIRIKITKNTKLHVWIIDNGKGYEKDSKIKKNTEEGHIGISNVAQRIALNYGKDYYLRIKSFKGRGTAVHLVLPVLQEEQGGAKDDQDCHCRG